jgi:hypothetical protein
MLDSSTSERWLRFDLERSDYSIEFETAGG